MSKMKTNRNANMELLRILSMVMVVFLHALNKSSLLVRFTSANMINPNTWIAWILEVMCVGAVNIFMLISGYFLVESEFKIGRLIEIVAQTVFYTLGAFILCCCIGVIDYTKVTIYDILNSVFPVHMSVFWFISAYVLIYIFQPILAGGIKQISQKNMRTVIILALVYECAFKSFIPVRFTSDSKGYSVLWYLIVFTIGAYFRLYGFKLLNTTAKGWIAYVISTLANLLVLVGVHHIIINFSHLEDLEKYSLEYNHILVLVAAVGIFAAFVNMKQKENRAGQIICFLSPMALGVYMCHENLSIRYEWEKWLGLTEIADKNPVEFLFRIVLGVFVVYCVGTIVDYLRIQLFKLVKKSFSKAKEKNMAC